MTRPPTRLAATLFAAALALICTAVAAAAHESRPLYVEIVEKAPNRFAVTWKIPPSALAVTSPHVVFPEQCSANAPPAGSDLVKRQLFTCRSDLSGAEVRIAFPRYNPSLSTLFRLERLSGEKHTVVKSPDEPAWTIPDREATASVARQYLALGVEHILLGFDHLLFIACLVFIAGTLRRVLITITGFTLAHSITLALAALNVVRVPVPPVEAAIALSIVFLAAEIARERRDTLTWRFPITVAVSFGLLHGFGFASVLNDIGLPQTEIVTALLFFNIGVEVGQVLFVAALGAALAVASRTGLIGRSRGGFEYELLPAALARPTAYVVGGLASWWMFSRIAGFVA